MDVAQAPGRDRADDRLRRWRYDYLRRAGLDHGPAATAAGDLRWDLNALLELVGRGCPPGLALRILDPPERKEGPR